MTVTELRQKLECLEKNGYSNAQVAYTIWYEDDHEERLITEIYFSDVANETIICLT